MSRKRNNSKQYSIQCHPNCISIVRKNAKILSNYEEKRIKQLEHQPAQKSALNQTK